jgi:hypothetical protein
MKKSIITSSMLIAGLGSASAQPTINDIIRNHAHFAIAVDACKLPMDESAISYAMLSGFKSLQQFVDFGEKHMKQIQAMVNETKASMAGTNSNDEMCAYFKKEVDSMK